MSGAAEKAAAEAAEGVLSPRTGRRWIPIVGLEVHCQLKTRTKLFCDSPYVFGAEPNTLARSRTRRSRRAPSPS